MEEQSIEQPKRDLKTYDITGREGKSVSFHSELEFIKRSNEDIFEEKNLLDGVHSQTNGKIIDSNKEVPLNGNGINLVEYHNNVNTYHNDSSINSRNGIKSKYSSSEIDHPIKSQKIIEENGIKSQLIEIKTKKMSYLPTRKPLDLEFSDLTYTVPNGRKKGLKTILKSINGKFKSGHLNGILGPSGAGKSTLMNILAGYRTNRISGEIRVNGKPRSLKHFRKMSCYIMQEDHLLPFLSIQESMEVASSLKLGNSLSVSAKGKLISEIVETLGLKDSTMTRVANLSGGEKKRLSIALELVNNPPIMFFDEPTSGLDSQNSYQCISLLRTLAEGGRTIICTIHQPSARLFEKFDTLYALAEGQCVYKGTTNGLVPFLSSLALECPSYHNPADFLIEIASGEYGDFVTKMVGAVNCGFIAESQTNETKQGLQLDLVKNQKEKESGSSNNGDCIYTPNEESIKLDITSCEQKFLNDDDDDNINYPTSFWRQFYVLFIRTFKSIVRDMMLTKLRLAAHILVGVAIGVLYFQIGNEASKALSNVGCLFFSLMFLLFTSMMPTILTFPLEMNVFVREHLNHWYSLKAYYFAKTMADLPFQIIFPIIYVIIVYFMTNQIFDIQRFLIFNVICIMTSLVAQSIGLTIGAAMDVQQAVFFGPAAAIPALLFSGFFASFSAIPVYIRWLTYLSYIRYGYEGVVLSIYDGEREPLECSEPFCLFKHPTKLLEQLDLNESVLWFDILMLLVYFLVMRALGYFILRWKLRKQR